MAPRKAPKKREVAPSENSVSKRTRIPRKQKNNEASVDDNSEAAENGNFNAEEKEETVSDKIPTKRGRKAKSAIKEKSSQLSEAKEETVENTKIKNDGLSNRTRKVKAKEAASELQNVESDNEAVSVTEPEIKKTKRGKKVIANEDSDESNTDLADPPSKKQNSKKQNVESDSEAVSVAEPEVKKTKRGKRVIANEDSDESNTDLADPPSKKQKAEANSDEDVKLSKSEEDVKEISKKPLVSDEKVGRKRKVNLKTNDEDSDFEDNAKISKSTEKAEVPKNEVISSKKFDFSNNSVSSDGKKWNLKITSWNVNGIRAWLQKDGLDYINQENSDILCVQETKCADNKLPTEIKNLSGYHCYWLSADKDGYSGVGILSKEKPIDVQYGIGIPKHDNEGRVITAEYAKFYLVTSYTPNAGNALVRLDYRQEFDVDFRNYIKKLDEKKPVILCGDLNVAHEEIDLANPKTNKKNAGFTKEERDGFSLLLSEGFVDSFRHLYPEEKNAYTFWTYMRNARAKNMGWRLDYFVLSKRFLDHLCDNVIRKDVLGSDHCPSTLFLAI